MDIQILGLLMLCYISGSIPWGYIAVKIKKGEDIRKIASGGTGATNASRVLGGKYGLIVLILDILKVWAPVALLVNSVDNPWYITGGAILGALGHIYPVWINFRGGKAVSSMVGVFFAILPWQVILIWFLFYVLVLGFSRMMSFASLALSSFAAVLFAISFPWEEAYFFLGIILFILVWISHRENIGRIGRGEERKIKSDSNK